MKKTLMVGLAAVLLVALSGAVVAAEEGPMDSRALGVSAFVLPYGEISGWPEGIDLPLFSGKAGDKVTTQTGNFEIVRNGSLLLTLELVQPLTQTFHFSGRAPEYEVPYGGGDYDFVLGTVVRLIWQRGRTNWWRMITVAAGPNVNEILDDDDAQPVSDIGMHTTTGFDSYVRLSKNWRLEVSAVLGDIDDQPEGEYSGEVVLTVSAPLS